MNTKKRVLAAVAIAALIATGASTVLAHGDDDKGDHMMGPGYGQGMMGQGSGGHMMSPGTMMGHGSGTMMGHGSGMMGSGFGHRVVPQQDLSVDDVRHYFEDRLMRRGNKRLKLGEVTEKDKNTFVAEIVTKDGSLVDKFEVDRHSGLMRRLDE